MKDPTKQADVLQKLMPNVKVFEDEFGKQFKVVSLRDLTIPLDGLTKGGGLKFRDITTDSIRDSDILLVSYPKTGIPQCMLLYMCTCVS